MGRDSYRFRNDIRTGGWGSETGGGGGARVSGVFFKTDLIETIDLENSADIRTFVEV